MGRRQITRELIGSAVPVGVSAVVTNLTALIDMWTVIGCISYFGAGTTHIPSGIAPEEIPQFIYGSFAGIALTVFNLVPSVTNMLGKGALTCVTSDWESGNRDSLKKSVMQALVTSAVIAIPAAVGLGVLSSEIMTFLFPRQSDEVAVCVNSLRLLMPGMVFLCVSYPLFSMLQAIGKTSLPLKIMLLGTAVKLIGNLALIPFMGVDGAALSTSLCYGIILAVSFAVFQKTSGVHISAAPFLQVLYAGIMCGASAYLVAALLEAKNMSTAAVIIFSALIGGMVYIGVIVAVLGKKLRIKKACAKAGL